MVLEFTPLNAPTTQLTDDFSLYSSYLLAALWRNWQDLLTLSNYLILESEIQSAAFLNITAINH